MKDSLFVLHELGEQLKQQVGASAASAIQSDQLSLSQRLCALEQGLCKQQAVLQVRYGRARIQCHKWGIYNISASTQEKKISPALRLCLFQEQRIKRVNKLGSSNGDQGRWEPYTVLSNVILPLNLNASF